MRILVDTIENCLDCFLRRTDCEQVQKAVSITMGLDCASIKPVTTSVESMPTLHKFQ